MQHGSMQRTKEIMQNPPAMTKQQIDAFTRFLRPFSVHWNEQKLPHEERDAMRIESDTIDDFRRIYRVVCFDVDPYQPLPEDPPDLPQGPALFHHFATLEAMETATPNQIRRLMMLCTRGEHWGTPWTKSLVSTGVAYAALKRLFALRDSAPDDPASFSEELTRISYIDLIHRKREETKRRSAAETGSVPPSDAAQNDG